MTHARKLLLSGIAMLPVTIALADSLLKSDTAALRQDYDREQIHIDLAVSMFRLRAAKGEITMEKCQDLIDQWLAANGPRLQAQADLAARLQSVASAPLPDAAASDGQELVEAEPDTPGAARRNVLAAAWESKMNELRARAESAENLQDLIDDWLQSPEGLALRQEKGEIEQSEARRWPLGTRPVVLEAAEDAPLAEVASLDFQEKVARRIMDLRAQNPLAGDEEMQDLIDGKMDEFKEDFSRINQLLGQAATERLEAEVTRLQAAAEGN